LEESYLDGLNNASYSQTIFCYTEEQGRELYRFTDRHDSDSIIHIFTPVINSCEGNILYCLADIINNCINTDGKLWFVTDIKYLYNIIKRIFHVLFEEIIYIEQGNKKEFDTGFDTDSLAEYIISIQTDIKQAAFMERFLNLKDCQDVTEFDAFLYELRNGGIKGDKYFVVSWCVFGELLLYGLECGSRAEDYLYYKLAVYSVLMRIAGNTDYTNIYLNEILSNEKLNAENLYFVWSHFKRILLTKLVPFDGNSEKKLDGIYDKSYNIFFNGLKKYLAEIPLEKRNKDLVIILAIQFLDDAHAPTRSVIERAKVLQELGKTVMIINTTEQYIKAGYIPVWTEGCGMVLDNYNNITGIKAGGARLRFYQMPKELPIPYKVQVLSQIINKLKPYYILSIGTGSILADLCGNIVPCASMALAFSTLPKTKNKMKILGRKLYPEEEKKFQDTDIIESRFTFELKPQKKQFSRSLMGLPEDKFILAVVGIRLQYEVSPAFLDMLGKVCKAGCHVVFAGIMDNYQQLMEEYPVISACSTFIGYCDDILALMEICDLYINPDRVGGGFSIIEAFYKGVPGVYLERGDVYVAGGEEFAVSNFDIMAEQVIRYKEDKDYYNYMAGLAKERAKLMTSSKEAIADIDINICKRIEEKYW